MKPYSTFSERELREIEEIQLMMGCSRYKAVELMLDNKPYPLIIERRIAYKINRAIERTINWAKGGNIVFEWPEMPSERNPHSVSYYKNKPDKLMQRMTGAEKNLQVASANYYHLTSIWEALLLED